MKKEKLIVAGFVIMLIALIILLAYCYNLNNKVKTIEENFKIIGKNIIGTMVHLEGSEWRCAGSECLEWVTGDEWVADNCRPTGKDNKMMCSMVTGGINVGGVRMGGEVIDYPLSEIDTSKVKSCRQSVCGGYLLIKNNLEARE